MTDVTLKNNISDLLEGASMTVRDLSELVGLSYQKVMRVASAGDDIKVSDAMKIAAVFKLGIDEIWPQAFSLKTEEVVTERHVITPNPENTAQESVFSE
jgi:transcriptional regulator with XRE-family HTH domain